ncbi:uncharacterized protein MYCGRDRAFT_107474 [Zymoseptoria tritici IPO323]|uniref:Zn(2)-C6 fungal-type domain-containing protein n=1 Tax=Zymoseptoria tritici (strain CBS 115943 / IPO323) TaxID=336722 RepID=F9WY99_ZYMTI|nr:uncharacterized protein MYCGRDRAFT_107474 [Zymoseptoria tritici IPO323]EGP91506.1 hypothetical protein MYCGRDRAFT_107474 [Zymoseptoria tritici IPO323]
MTTMAMPMAIDTAPAATPRKRRRRTAASGATDDCFSCRRRCVPCDRKRPYCSQCIQIGKECSGYKTTLTWGVGVASRGKLRGLSCPIAGKNAESGESSDEQRTRRKSSISKVKQENSTDFTPRSNSMFQVQFSPPTSAPISSTSAPSFQPTLPTIQARQQGWQIPNYQDRLQSSPNDSHVRPSPLRHHSLQHILTTFGPQQDASGRPRSSSSLDSPFDEQLNSPLEYSGSAAFNEPFPSYLPMSYPHHAISHSVESINCPQLDSYHDGLSSSVDSLRSIGSFPDEMDSFNAGTMSHDEMLFSPDLDASYNFNPFDQLEFQDENQNHNEQKQLNIFDPRFSTPFFNMSPRLQSLMEYYDRHVCTYLVAFDGPENPYRRHILQLAVNNECLQNAIAALATNNIRMRKEPPPRRLGFVEELTDAFDNVKARDWNEATPEETCYKQMSIDQLNMQLTDVRAAQDDSVLATLLILCLFHVCDSGFSKFKTQLAGVQKLLSLRDPTTESDFTGWVRMFFIWFDVMTSAVNDRETQIKGESLDMLDYSANLGALEQFSGCDGRLFKLIARLGRLNLLAQGRPVRQDATYRSTTTAFPIRPTLPKRGSTNNTVIDFSNLDNNANNWGSPTYSDSNSTVCSAEEEILTPGAMPDDRHEFWTEWHDIRARLHAWQMETPTTTSFPSCDANASQPQPHHRSTSPPELAVGQRDLLHINESFRYSALLYTERLGHPFLPSSHPNFQKYVNSALSHISALEITSCVNKFLLWPLFITGTECVDEGHRNIIRTRCVEVQIESGFYNNLSSLEVLERVWAEVGPNVPGMEQAEVNARRRDSTTPRTGLGRYGCAFRWRKAMDRVDGEYIVI